MPKYVAYKIKGKHQKRLPEAFRAALFVVRAFQIPSFMVEYKGSGQAAPSTLYSCAVLRHF